MENQATDASVRRRGSSEEDGDRPAKRRSGPACLRCRRQKVRCSGGQPCLRCTKSGSACDMSLAITLNTTAGGPAGSSSDSVQPALSMSTANVSDVNATSANFGSGVLQQQPHASSSRVHWSPQPARQEPSSLVNGLGQPPGQGLLDSLASTAAEYGVLPFHAALSSESDKLEERVAGSTPGAKERLDTAMYGRFAPPFKSLVYQPSSWDNREPSRRNSPERDVDHTVSQIAASPVPGLFTGQRSDPIELGLLDEGLARYLFTFYVDHCHPFLPIIDIGLQDAFDAARQSQSLLSAILAVSLRFYSRYATRLRELGTECPSLPHNQLPVYLAELAECQLALTMLHKRQNLLDVQAILILAAWGLRSGGRGPDSWILTGHAARVGLRLGLHKENGGRLTEQSSNPDIWQTISRMRTRVTLSWFDGFLSLGFGRPQTPRIAKDDEHAFMHMRLSPILAKAFSDKTMSGDMFIAGQAQVANIGREINEWRSKLSDVEIGAADPTSLNDYDFGAQLQELNAKIDAWFRRWVWAGSANATRLGTAARLSRLQAEHMRLCLNSYALELGSKENGLVAQCLQKAVNAAMAIIQAHHESSQTDLALSFASDYVTISLPQAAVFLLRIQKSDRVPSAFELDRAVVVHYLEMAIQVLRTSDLSETGLSTYLANTISEIALVAGFGPKYADQTPTETSTTRDNGQTEAGVAGDMASGGPMTDIFPVDEQGLLNFDALFGNNGDLGYMLGLSADGNAEADRGTRWDGQNMTFDFSS